MQNLFRKHIILNSIDMETFITILSVVAFIVAMVVMAFAGGKKKDVEPKNEEK